MRSRYYNKEISKEYSEKRSRKLKIKKKKKLLIQYKKMKIKLWESHRKQNKNIKGQKIKKIRKLEDQSRSPSSN